MRHRKSIEHIGEGNGSGIFGGHNICDNWPVVTSRDTEFDRARSAAGMAEFGPTNNQGMLKVMAACDGRCFRP